MKKTLKSAGAVGLAAATILTGLSFGPAAAYAAPAGTTSTAPSSEAITVTQSLAPTLTDGGNEELHISIDNPGDRTPQGLKFSFTAPSGTTFASGPWWRLNSGGWLGLPGCSYTSANTKITCDIPEWSAAASSRLDMAVRLKAAQPLLQRGRVSDGAFEIVSGAAIPATEIPLSYIAHEGFSADYDQDDVDISSRSVELRGTGTPGAVVLVKDEQTTVESDGTWTLTVNQLTLGSNALTVTQWENKIKADELPLDVELRVSPLDVNTSFPTDHSKEVIAAGTAHPGAVIVIQDAAGTEIARTTASDIASGAWSTEIPAPNAGGSYDVIIHQEIDGEANGEITETIAYGAAVTTTSPVDDAAHLGGPVSMSGTGEPLAQITVREQGHPTVIGNATVLVNGNWNLNTTSLNDRKHVLVVTQTGKGNNVTTSTITLNPEAVDTPVTVTNPANPADGYTPSTSFTFEGTATAGKAVTVENKWGTHLGDATMNGENWSWTRANMGTTTWQLRFVQDKGQPTESVAEVMDFKPNAAPAPLVVVTNPANVADGYTPNTSFTFRGTATAGKAVTVENKWGTHLGDATMNGENWSWTRANMGTTTWQLHFVQDKGLTTEFTAKVLGFTPNAAPAPLVVVTNPADPADGYTPNAAFTFRGTATAGKTITVENKFGTHIATAPVDGDGNWSWTRANMGTSIWHLLFVQDKGQPAEATATVMNFKPIA